LTLHDAGPNAGDLGVALDPTFFDQDPGSGRDHVIDAQRGGLEIV
jgi:hypothetical protein